MREVKLPSGAVLKITPAPFSTSKALYQAVLRELRAIHLDSKVEMSSLLKDVFCAGFSSAEVETALWECMARCTYNSGKGDLKIDADTFEPLPCRDDYVKVCAEVAKDNVLPFVKSLYAEYLTGQAMTEGILK